MELCLLPLSFHPDRLDGGGAGAPSARPSEDRPRLWKRLSQAAGTGAGGGAVGAAYLCLCAGNTSLSEQILHIVYTCIAACLPSDVIVPAGREEEDGRRLHRSSPQTFAHSSWSNLMHLEASLGFYDHSQQLVSLSLIAVDHEKLQMAGAA